MPTDEPQKIFMKKHILFVDDEKRILDGLKRRMRIFRNKWDMCFALSGKEALGIMSQNKIDVLVTDIQMPQMSGAELLKIVQKKYPHIIRIVLTGHTNKETLMRVSSYMHMFLTKPCDAKSLENALQNGNEINKLMQSDNIKKIVSQMKSLPSKPDLYFKIMQEFKKSNYSSKSIGKIINKDIAMSAKVLQIVNSAYCGLQKPISNPTQAVIYLGINMIKNLVLTANLFVKFEGNNIHSDFIYELWSHSINTSSFCKIIAKEQNKGELFSDDAFMAGLLHDVGKLILATNFPKKYSFVLKLIQEENYNTIDAENKIFRTNHSEVGAYLLNMWGLPTSIILSTIHHHRPLKLKKINYKMELLPIVHIANYLEHKIVKTISVHENTVMDEKNLKDSGFADNIQKWEKLCSENYIKRMESNEQ